jgi:hypothetical protein
VRWVLLIVLLSTLVPTSPALQEDGPHILSSEAHIQFPDEIEFSIEIAHDEVLELVELEYGLDVRACAVDVNRVTPEDYEPSNSVSVNWVWNMRRTGSLPPGARIWWQWHIVDESGYEVRTDREWLVWLDDTHVWQTLQAGNILLHWYAGDQNFAMTLLDAAEQAQRLLAEDIGTRLGRDVHLYIYADSEDMREAVLFEAGWTGGLAYSDHAIVLIGINESNLAWGLDSIAHEMAHVIIGKAVDHCYSALPSWLSEGLAVYAEGELDEASGEVLEEAITQDILFSVRSLSDGFSEHAGRAHLSYAQSYSLVDYLISTFGQQKMLELLEAFQSGYRYDHALHQVYGFDADGLDGLWRQTVGVSVQSSSSSELEPTATVYPTIQPYSAPPLATTSTSLPEQTQSSPSPFDEESQQSAVRAAWILGICVLSVILFLGFVYVLRRQGRKRVT